MFPKTVKVIHCVILKTLVLRQEQQTKFLPDQKNVFSLGPAVKELLQCTLTINIQLHICMQIVLGVSAQVLAVVGFRERLRRNWGCPVADTADSGCSPTAAPQPSW